MIPFAAKNNLRLLFVNLRDYPGSSPYTKAELEAFESGDEATQDKAISDLGKQLGAFLAYFVKNNDVPPVNKKGGNTIGGISLLTWSMSNLVSISFLAHANTLTDDVKDVLNTHLRSVVLHGEWVSHHCTERILNMCSRCFSRDAWCEPSHLTCFGRPATQGSLQSLT